MRGRPKSPKYPDRRRRRPPGCRLSTSTGVAFLHPWASCAAHDSRIDLLQGTLDLLILQTLQWGPQHGYGISQAIRLHSSDLLQVDTGSLYPAMHRLERQGWIRAEWKAVRQQPARARLPADRGRTEAPRRRAHRAGRSCPTAIAGILNRAGESEA